jgi:2-polyprenyl-3-methyl-5-hydroxy-6-metoxy-1,4-benzoquinol methylase
MRTAAERSASSTVAMRNANGDESAAANTLLKAQVDFNQALVLVLSSMAQYLRQSRTSDRPATVIRMPAADVTPRMEAIAAQIEDVALRLNHAVEASTAADQNDRALISALGDRLDLLSQSAAAFQQLTADQFKQLQQSAASSHAALEQSKDEVAAVRHQMQQQLAELELRLFRAEHNLRKTARSDVSRSAASLETATSQILIQSGSNQPLAGTANGVTASAANRATDDPFDYFLFEQRFRGPIEDIKQRQQAYLDYFLQAENVLDLGCGRGEFVELLTERKVPIIGIDSSEDMVDFCRARGLPVLQGDLFEHLDRQIDGAIGGIFISQVVEHLTADQVWKLIQLASTKLKVSGVLLLETINPQCFPAISCFYLDPSHVRPYHAGLLSFMCQQVGFRLECVQFSAPLPGASTGAVLKAFGNVPPAEASQYQDYAVIARRSSGACGYASE